MVLQVAFLVIMYFVKSKSQAYQGFDVGLFVKDLKR